MVTETDSSIHRDALMTCEALKYEDLAPPRRVLDLGCGMSAHWCLEMLRREGWEQTHFVGEFLMSFDFYCADPPIAEQGSTLHP